MDAWKILAGLFTVAALAMLAMSLYWFKSGEVMFDRGHALQAAVACGAFSVAALLASERKS